MNLKWKGDRLKKLSELYASGLGMKDVASRLGVSLSSVNNAMRRNNIPRRTPSESNRINFLRSPLSYKEKMELTHREESLKLAGLMLYWAEGSKRNKHVVDLANCDEKMILLFLKFLRIIYGTRENKLRVYLYCYSNQKPAELVNYWSNLTKIPVSQFSRPYVKVAPNSRVHGKMERGLVHIRYADMRLLSIIKQEISRLAETL